MFYWRITKYNPVLRSQQGFFSSDEWTSITDVGKFYGNKIFTLDEYLETEQAYIKAIMMVATTNSIKTFRVECLEKKSQIPTCFAIPISKEEKELYGELMENMKLPMARLPLLARLVLRELCWCKIKNDEMYLHFGYDYYMYLGSIHQINKGGIEAMGLFIEESRSPYLDDY